MQNDERLVCLLGGIGIGMIGGLLLAPASGRQTRKRLNGYLREGVEQGEELLDRGSHQIDASIDKGKRLASDLKEKVQDTIGDAACAARKVTDQVIDRAREAAHDAGKTIEKGGKRLQHV